jgi:NAD(P)H-hydrate repair Nnr-like enzyme with NAD(P)H-hydrate dehydratase domain
MKERQRISSMKKKKCTGILQEMATAGSDVLTGIITSLLAQSYEPTLLLFAYLHGLAADIALPETASVFIASDIIKYLGKQHF